MTCKLCPLWESALVSNCMKGSGPEGAEIMLVGQGPGGREDVAGVPFVGKSGQLLDEMLADAGLDRSKLFITNATRCRPPTIDHKERPPTPDEINTCRRYLIEEVQRVRPAAIVAMGDAALRALLKTSGVKSKRGQEFQLHPVFGYACPVFVTYHPAALLHTPGAMTLRKTVTADLRKVRDRGLEAEPIAWEESLFPPVAERLAYDIETYDTHGNITDTPTQIAVAGNGEARVSLDVPLMADCLREVAPRCTIISHFGWDYDDCKTGIQSDRDTAALAYLDDENQPLGLESLCVKYLGVRGWKEDREGAKLGSDELAVYNARDAVNTLRLHDCLEQRLGPRIKIADRILLPARLALNECSRRGIWIDGDEVAVARARFYDEIEKARYRCKALSYDDLNPGSNKQVGEYIVGAGFALPLTPTGEYATDKGLLQELATPFADAVIDYREAVKADSTYGKPYEAAARSADHRMHNEYTVIRTVTGRTSARRSNVQNLDRELRGFFGYMDMADYAGIEFRLAAWIAQEPTILGNYAANRFWDPHKFFGSHFYDKPEELVTVDGPNSERQISKSANFSQLFLGTGETLVDYGAKVGARIPHTVAHAAHKAFLRIYPGFIPWWNSILEDIKRQGYVESPTGRRRNFGDWKMLNYASKQAAWREAVNFPVQSLAADLALLGLSCAHRAGLPINGFFHDAIGFDVEGNAPIDAETIRCCMVDEPLQILRQEFGVNITIPIEIEIKRYNKKKEELYA